MEDDMPEIKTGNHIDRDLAATTNDRLKKTVLELRGLVGEIKTLSANVVQLNRSSDKYSLLQS